MRTIHFRIQASRMKFGRFLLAVTILLAPVGTPALAEGYCVLDHPLPFLTETPYADLRILILLSSDLAHKPADILNEIAATSLADNGPRGNLLIATEADTSGMVSAATTSGRADVIVLVDDTFMVEGRPKYNELLSAYRNAQIAPENVMVMDGILRSNRDRPIVVLIRSSISDKLLAHLAEVATLITYTGSAGPKLMTYASALLADPASDKSIADAIEKKRPSLFEGCALVH